MKELQVQNRQRDRRVDTGRLGAIARALLEELLGLGEYALGIHLVSARRMAQVNEGFLQHTGPTDVITFDLRERAQGPVFGEIYICVSVAERQAKEFRTTWQSELVRYLVHGVLHLLGYDDLSPDLRKLMKRQENRLVRALEKRFPVAELGT